MIRFEYDVNTAGMRISWVVRDGAMSSMPGNLMDLPGSNSDDGMRWIKQDSATLEVLREALDHCIEAEKKNEEYRAEQEKAVVNDWKATGRTKEEYLAGLKRCNTPWSRVNMIENILKRYA